MPDRVAILLVAPLLEVSIQVEVMLTPGPKMSRTILQGGWLVALVFERGLEGRGGIEGGRLTRTMV